MRQEMVASCWQVALGLSDECAMRCVRAATRLNATELWWRGLNSGAAPLRRQQNNYTQLHPASTKSRAHTL